jgi:uncharacterized protein YlxW (UPF0749 family)
MRWLIVVPCLALLAGCGGATTKTVTDTAALQDARAQIKTERSDAQNAVAEARKTLASERSKLSKTRQQVSAEKRRLRRLQGQVSGVRQQISANTVDGEGTYVVGSDIKPGTWRASASPGCYWARLRSLDTSDIIDNDNADGPVVIQVLPSDKALQVSGCSSFHKVG